MLKSSEFLSRPHDGLPSQLCLKELLSMMIDIGRGGAYLETFKHVHRDLAARNCLLSSKFPAQRITKIGDFGLARDIFSQDYYRIHGSDFLPLRWLAPESAVSGIFTTKSDVWAFGIVLWEIMSLGQQPYPGLTNFDVLTGLHEGRTPRRPAECPDEIFAIMSAAWTADPFKRPTFADLLFKLESLRGKPHLQSTDPFPSSHLGFESSQGSKSSMNQPMTNDSSTTTSWRSARGIYADDASPLGDGNISATATPSRQHANRGAKPRVDKNDFRQNNFFKGAANTTTRQNAYATFERPESKLSGTTMSTVIDNHIDNEYEQPIRFSFSNRPNSQLQRSHEGEITNRKYGGSLDSYTNPGFIADSDSTGHGQSPSKNHTVGYHR